MDICSYGIQRVPGGVGPVGMLTINHSRASNCSSSQGIKMVYECYYCARKFSSSWQLKVVETGKPLTYSSCIGCYVKNHELEQLLLFSEDES